MLYLELEVDDHTIAVDQEPCKSYYRDDEEPRIWMLSTECHSDMPVKVPANENEAALCDLPNLPLHPSSEVSSCDPSDDESSEGRRRVSFGDVRVREYEKVSGVSPSWCRGSKTCALGWEFQELPSKSLDEYDESRRKIPTVRRRRHRQSPIVPIRYGVLKSHFCNPHKLSTQRTNPFLDI